MKSKTTYIVASSQNWRPEIIANLTKRTGEKFILINKKNDFSAENLKSIKPQFIFIPHWSYIIKPEIFDNYKCIIFHMTDVPFGRGGSPLQNLISRGIHETMISALRCEAGVDTGSVYMKRPLSLYGTAQEIYMRGNAIIEDMITAIIREQPEPTPQKGQVTCFPRRTPNESNINSLDDLEKVFDYIRMLDAESYPKAFIETEHLRFEFQRASLNQDQIIADVRITKKNHE